MATPKKAASPSLCDLSAASLSPRFKVPDTPNPLSFLDETSRDSYQAVANDEKECKEFYKEFDGASFDEDSNFFSKLFKSPRSGESSPTCQRLDFSSFPSLDSPAPTSISTGKRSIAEAIGAVREDPEDGSFLNVPNSKRKRLFPTTEAKGNTSLDSILENSNSSFGIYWSTGETSNG